MMKSIISKTVDFFFDLKKSKIMLIFLVGLILRIIAANNLGVSADDVNHAYRPIGIFNSEKLVIWDQSTSLWYYFQGVFYNLFGLTQFSSRFGSLLIGSFLIVLIYLFCKRVFESESIALLSSFLVAISPILIRNTMPEMDVAASFFIILAAYFLFGYLEKFKKGNLFLMSLALGVGIMIKLYVAFFALSFLVFLFYKELKMKAERKKVLKEILLIGLILFLLCLPTFTHNYLLYKDKGFTDLIFTNFLRVGLDNSKNFYGWSAGWLPYTDFQGFFFGNQKNFDPTSLPGFIIVLGFILKGDPITFIFGLIGLIIFFKLKKDYSLFVLLTILPALIYLGANIPMSKHFIWMVPLLVPFASLLLLKITKIQSRIKLKYIMIIALIISLFFLGTPRWVSNSSFYGKSSFGQVVDFKENIPQNSLVVVDSRIYRGNIHWAFAGKNYLESTYFFELANQLNAPGSTRLIEVYYFECVYDDCGWGTIKDQKEFNQSMEEITAWFANISGVQKNFSGPVLDQYYFPFVGKKDIAYRMYKTSLPLNPQILNAVKQTHTWFLYPYSYDRTIADIFDDYSPRNILDKMLEKIAWFILYLELILMFLAFAYIIYKFSII